MRGIDIGTRAKDRGLLANDITQLRLLSTHVPFEVDNLRWSAQTLRALQNRIVALTPLISAVEDRVRAFQSDGRELPGDLRLVMSDLAQWVEAGADAFPEPLREIRETLSRILAAIPPRPDWHDMLAASLATRLRELAKTYAQCLRLRRLIDAAGQRTKSAWCATMPPGSFCIGIAAWRCCRAPRRRSPLSNAAHCGY